MNPLGIKSHCWCTSFAERPVYPRRYLLSLFVFLSVPRTTIYLWCVLITCTRSIHKMYLTLIRKMYVYSRGDLIYSPREPVIAISLLTQCYKLLCKTFIVISPLSLPPFLAYNYYTLLIYCVEISAGRSHCKFVNTTQLSNCILTVNSIIYILIHARRLTCPFEN